MNLTPLAQKILSTEDADYREYDATTHTTPTKLNKPLVVLKSAVIEDDVVTVKAVAYHERYSFPRVPATREAIEYGICGPLSVQGLEVVSVTERREPAVHLAGGISATAVTYRLEVAVHE